MTSAADPTRRVAVPAPAARATTPAETGLALPVKLYFLAVMIPIGFNLGPLYMTGMRLLLLSLVVPMTFMLISGRFGKLHLVDFAFFAHVAWMAVALSVNNPNMVVQNVGSTGIEFLGGYLVGRAYIRTPAQFIALCKLLSVLVLCLLPFALYETQTGRPIIVEMIRRIPGLRSESIVTIEPRLGLERVQAVFAHPIHFGLFCSVAFSMTYVGLRDLYTRRTRLVVSALIGLSGFLALSSGAFLAMVMQLFLIGWAAALRNVPSRWWILVGLAVIAYVVIDLLSDRSPVRVFMSYATFSPHNAYWRGIIFEWGMKNILGDAENNIPPAPVFGIGLNDWVRPFFMYSGSMDNFWLVMGVRFGLPGVLLLALGYFVTLWAVMRRDFQGDETLMNLRRAWIFTFVGLTFTLCTVHIWTTIYSFVFFMFGAGVWFLTATPHSGQPDAEPEAQAGARRAGPYSRFPLHPARGQAGATAASPGR